ncbi:MAG: M20/M25/M40 family metallo-hydrolase [Myxococcota bacterium]|nr:M20/M25/M40 family metallo-hydrolase [Myxococcota bacterium]
MSEPHPLLERIDWDAACAEATEIFRALLRIDTTNSPVHPGNEIEACRYLDGVLAGAGIESRILESAPGRGNLVCRLEGDGSGGEPILLSAHLDVVPADPEHWEHPPFGAEIHDGFIWGRGAIDMKNMAAMEVITMLLLKRAGLPLKRDLIFAAVADEEAGCEMGSLWLAEHHPELVRGEYAISEIGGFTLHAGGKRFYPVQVAEKGVCWITVRATGTPGHGSLPNKDNPIPKIARAAEKLGMNRLPHHRSAVVDRFIRTLAKNHSFPSSAILRSLLRPSIAGLILDSIFPDKSLASSFDAMLHNTANPTILQAGLKVNQVPGEASLQVDGRLLPGQTGADLVREIEALIGEGYAYTIDRELPAIEGDPDDPMGERIREVLARHDPEGIPIPTMIPGFTDAKAYDRLGMKCWGFSPVRLPPGVNFAQMFHGHNERIPVDGFHFGVRALFDLVTGLVL